MKGNIMFNKKSSRILARSLMTLALAATLLLVNDPALAWGRKKKKETKRQPNRAVNLDQYPSMNIYRGVLRLHAHGEWYLDKRPLSFSRNSRITDTPDSEGGTALVEGRQAKVTAAEVGGTLIVRRVTMFTSSEMMERGHYNVGRKTDEPESGSANTPR